MTNRTIDAYMIAALAWIYMWRRNRRSEGFTTIKHFRIVQNSRGDFVESSELSEIMVERFDNSWIATLSAQEYEAACRTVFGQRCELNGVDPADAIAQKQLAEAIALDRSPDLFARFASEK